MNPENDTPTGDGTALRPNDYVERILADTALFANAVVAGPLDAPVAACPDWDLERLTVHMAWVHRWATQSALHATRPDGVAIDEPSPGLDAAGLAAWLTDGAHRLGEVLTDIDPDAPTWHPFPVARHLRVWPRRQAHETSIHRWDAQRAVADAHAIVPDPIEATFASDGIDEYFEIALPRVITREMVTPPAGSVHVHCTDVPGEWLVWYDDDGYHLVREHRKGDAALRGPAEQLLLALYGRDGDRSQLSPVGDEDVLQGWFDLPGL